MDLIHAELLAAGSRIAPLTTFDEIAAFFYAAAAIGPTVPARATSVAQWLGGSLADAGSMFASILPTLPSMPNVERLLSMLPPCENMSIGPNRDTCAVCKHGMLEPAEHFTTAPLLSAKGCIKPVKLFKRKCSCCQADHHLSYASGGLRLGRGEQVPYEGCTDARYFHITTSCVWETSLLVDFEAQALNSHTGFSTFMAEYTMKYGGDLPFSDDRAPRAFAIIDRMVMRPAGFLPAAELDVRGMELHIAAEFAATHGLGDGLQNWTKQMSSKDFDELTEAS